MISPTQVVRSSCSEAICEAEEEYLIAYSTRSMPPAAQPFPCEYQLTSLPQAHAKAALTCSPVRVVVPATESDVAPQPGRRVKQILPVQLALGVRLLHQPGPVRPTESCAKVCHKWRGHRHKVGPYLGFILAVLCKVSVGAQSPIQCIRPKWLRLTCAAHDSRDSPAARQHRRSTYRQRCRFLSNYESRTRCPGLRTKVGDIRLCRSEDTHSRDLRLHHRASKAHYLKASPPPH
jgi:hypothetical protein